MAKKILGMEDYKLWRTVVSTQLTNDGQWVTFDYNKPCADKDAPDERRLQVTQLQTRKTHEIPLAVSPEFSDDAHWLACKIETERREARKLKDKKEPVPEKVHLLNLDTGASATWEHASAFVFSKGSRALAVHKTGVKEAKHEGKDLVVRDLKRSIDHLLGSVSAFAFNKPGTLMAYTVDAADKTGNGVYVMELETGVCMPLDQGPFTYSQMKWAENGTAVAALKGSGKDGCLHRENSLLAFIQVSNCSGVRHELEPAKYSGFPTDMVISEQGELSWDTDATRVFFGIKEQEPAAPKKDKDDKDDKDDKKEPEMSDVDVWHWKDERIQSVQRARAEQEHAFTYGSVFTLKAGRFVRLADERMRHITLTRTGRWVVGSDQRAFIHDWKPLKADYYRVDADTGERVPIRTALQRSLGVSPDSRHFAYWYDKHVWVFDLDAGTSRNLTKDAPASFVDQEYDLPDERPSYGVAGWSADGKSLILNHRYDVWLQPLNGDKAVNLTGGVGAKDEICLRHIRFDEEEQGIDLSKPLILSAYGQWTKKAGFYRLDAGATTAVPLVFKDKWFGTPVKAKDADAYLFSIESFVESPDYYVSDGTFTNPNRITNANPHQADYAWGRTVLIDYTNRDGVRLQGMLAVPDLRNGNERLAMIVSFYEKLSQDLNRYMRPDYAHSAAPYMMEMVSKGMLLLAPDIHFRCHATGDDILECIETAVEKAVELGYADAGRVGLCGHSFSGYGAAYIATRSRKFAAVSAGAGVMELGSDFHHLWGYSPDRKKGGGHNAHQYEVYGQGRMDTNPHDNHELYRSQSPLTHVPGMTTPVLLMQGESDELVAWIEAVSLYNAMRFNGKEIILLSYPDEGHGLGTRVNQVDYTRRMLEFFNHHLLGAPAPDWMTKGVPFLEKERKKRAAGCLSERKDERGRTGQ